MITKKASLKQTIVLILGILFVLNEITTGIYGYVRVDRLSDIHLK